MDFCVERFQLLDQSHSRILVQLLPQCIVVVLENFVLKNRRNGRDVRFAAMGLGFCGYLAKLPKLLRSGMNEADDVKQDY